MSSFYGSWDKPETKRIIVSIAIAVCLGLFVTLLADIGIKMLGHATKQLPSWQYYLIQGGVAAAVLVAIVLLMEFGIRRPLAAREEAVHSNSVGGGSAM